LNLFYEKNQHITVYKTKIKLEAFTVAKQLKQRFGVEILDATE
jgi:hypothetical protein